MIGPRISGRNTPRIGAVGDVAGAPGDPFAGVTRDGTSNIYVPADATEWSTLRTAGSLGTVNPNHLWLMQDASGNPAAAIGTALAAFGPPAYQQAVAGWDRDAIVLTNGSSITRTTLESGVGPDPATTSTLWFGIISFPASPGTIRNVLGNNNNSGTSNIRVQHNTTGRLRLQVNGVNADGTDSHSSGVHPVVLKHDRTGNASVVYTDLEKLTGTHSDTVVDGRKGFGSGTGAGCLYLALWEGAAAEAFTDAAVKAMLETMGFTIPWS